MSPTCRLELGCGVSLKDIFDVSSVAELARRIDPGTEEAEAEADTSEPAHVQEAEHDIFLALRSALFLFGFLVWWVLPFLCDLPGYYVIAMLFTNGWTGGMMDEAEMWSHSKIKTIIFMPLLLPSAFIIQLAVTVLIKRLLLWKAKPGEYSVYSLYYFRWWLSNLLIEETYIITTFLQGTPMQNFYFRLLGADIGKGVRLNTSQLSTVDLISIADYATVDTMATISASQVRDGMLILRPVVLGWKSHIGVQTSVLPGAVVGDSVDIGPMSVVAFGAVIPPLTSWQGSPLVQVETYSATRSPALDYEFHEKAFYVFGMPIRTPMTLTAHTQKITHTHRIVVCCHAACYGSSSRYRLC